MARRNKRKQPRKQAHFVPESVHVTRDMLTAEDEEAPVPAIARQANHFSPERCRDVVCAMTFSYSGVSETRIVAGFTMPCDSPFKLHVVAGDYQEYFERNDPRVLLRKEYMYLLAHPDEIDDFFQGCNHDEVGVLADYIRENAF